MRTSIASRPLVAAGGGAGSRKLVWLLAGLLATIAVAVPLFLAYREDDAPASASIHQEGRGEWLVYGAGGARLGRLVLGENLAAYVRADGNRVESSCTIAVEDGRIRIASEKPLGDLGRQIGLSRGALGWQLTSGARILAASPAASASVATPPAP